MFYAQSTGTVISGRWINQNQQQTATTSHSYLDLWQHPTADQPQTATTSHLLPWSLAASDSWPTTNCYNQPPPTLISGSIQPQTATTSHLLPWSLAASHHKLLQPATSYLDLWQHPTTNCYNQPPPTLISGSIPPQTATTSHSYLDLWQHPTADQPQTATTSHLLPWSLAASDSWPTTNCYNQPPPTLISGSIQPQTATTSHLLPWSLAASHHKLLQPATSYLDLWQHPTTNCYNQPPPTLISGSIPPQTATTSHLLPWSLAASHHKLLQPATSYLDLWQHPTTNCYNQPPPTLTSSGRACLAALSCFLIISRSITSASTCCSSCARDCCSAFSSLRVLSCCLCRVTGSKPWSRKQG